MPPKPKSGILDIDLYVPGKSKVPEGVRLHKLSSNESPLGSSPAAIIAAKTATEKMEEYPDGSATALRTAIAETHGLNPDNLICGNGSDEILTLLANTYLGSGDEAIFTEHGFLIYRIATLAAGGVPVSVAEEDCKASVDNILAAVTEKTKLVFIANPNNPTGTYLPIDEMRRLQAGLPEHVVLVIDAAYAEYVRRNDYEAGLEMVSGNENVIMTRTFSKIHGLAALRIGWAYGPTHMIEALNRIRGPFNMNAAAIAAGSAAIRDRQFIDSAVAHNDTWLTKVTEGLEALGLRVTPSVSNFVLIHFPKDPARNAEAADRYLTERGYVLRRVTGYGFPNALRMSIGTEEANRGTLETLKEFLA
ncbi:MAG: histidinol-phosphate transaminase [Rhizobiaceae bacterium]|nr:histidinol-phosphate transaminase [Rhizobiaceae bacterium]